MNYKDLLLRLMDINLYSFLPNYPFKESLDDLEDSKEIEDYCFKVLSNLDELVEVNK